MYKQDLKVYASIIEEEAMEQINQLLSQEPFRNCKVRIMPDVHAGNGCVIGFTGDLGDKVIPNVVGVDIGCGMITVSLGQQIIDLKMIDEIIHKYIPAGFNVHDSRKVKFPSLQETKCYRFLKDTKRMERSIGTLGGGNHFVEICKDENNMQYLIIHTGSRNFGKQVADYYQSLAIDLCSGKMEYFNRRDALIEEYKTQGRRSEISAALESLKREFADSPSSLPKDLCFLYGKYRDDYLHDMSICQDFAQINREVIANTILEKAFKTGLPSCEYFHTVHNYIDLKSNIVRKGAISALKGEKVLIPINMRDGCIIGIGKGNADWNFSAPHGAGRLMSRGKARAILDLDDFRKEMNGIYTTSVSSNTIDEAPMAYKPISAILDCLEETVEIMKIIKPIYNFKASGD